MATILIVEGDRLFRWALKEALRDAGFEVIEARNGREARQSFSGPVDLAILDFHLQDAPGLLLLSELREARVNCPVMVLTAHATDEGAVAAATLGASHYSAKPNDPREVVRMVSSLLGKRDIPHGTGVFRA